MANTLSAIIPTILSNALLVLRERSVMPRLVNSDYSTEAEQPGSTIDVPVPTAVGTRNVAPSNTPPSGTATVAKTVPVPLDNWKQNDPIFLTDKDVKEVLERHILPSQMDEAVRSLANDVNAQVMSKYKGIYGSYGATDSIPFNSTDKVKHATQVRKVLNQQNCPKGNRRMVLNFEAEAEAITLDQFADAEKTLSNEVKIEGEIGRKYGFDIVADDAVPIHTAGTFGGDPDVTAETVAGLELVNISCDADDTIALLVGDIILLAGDTQQYVVTANITIANSATGNVAISPPLKTTIAENSVITMVHGTGNDYTVNLAFHRDAFAYATRILDEGFTGTPQGGANIMTLQDPVTGIVLRLEVSRQHKQTAWEFDILWGAELVRPEMAARIVGQV